MGFPLTENVVEMLMEEMKEYILLVKLISHAVFVFKSSFPYGNIPSTYKDMISHWQEWNNVVPTSKKDVLGQNSFGLINS